MKNRPADIMQMANTEAATLIVWLTEHRKNCRKDITIKQTHAPGLGTNTYVVCSCKAEHNITDYDLW